MEESLFIGVSVAAAAVAVANWRAGILMVLLLGVLQDPFRKLIAGQPPYFTVWAAAAFAVVVVSAWVRRDLLRAHYLALGSARLRSVGALLAVLVALQALNALVRWGNPMVPALGLIFYLAPVMALVVGLSYVRSLRDIEQFVLSYVVITVPVALTVYLSYWYQADWAVLRDVGSFTKAQIIIYDVGAALESYSGLFRTGEIAAWHAATAASLLLLMALDNRSLARRLLVGLLVVALVGTILLTGRRKMLMALTIFVILQLGMLATLRRGAGRALGALIILGVVGTYGLTLYETEAESVLYLKRGMTVFGHAGDRGLMALGLFEWAVLGSEGIGLGIGTAAQGAQHAGTQVTGLSDSGEAGIGKLVLELGIPGLVLVTALFFFLGRRVWDLVRLLARYDQRLHIYAVSFLALLVANMVTFTVATQVYGDPFVLLVLGLVAGLLFSTLYVGLNRQAQDGASLRRLARAPVPQEASSST